MGWKNLEIAKSLINNYDMIAVQQFAVQQLLCRALALTLALALTVLLARAVCRRGLKRLRRRSFRHVLTSLPARLTAF